MTTNSAVTPLIQRRPGRVGDRRGYNSMRKSMDNSTADYRLLLNSHCRPMIRVVAITALPKQGTHDD
jgi:hypothetical protein